MDFWTAFNDEITKIATVVKVKHSIGGRSFIRRNGSRSKDPNLETNQHDATNVENANVKQYQ